MVVGTFFCKELISNGKVTHGSQLEHGNSGIMITAEKLGFHENNMGFAVTMCGNGEQYKIKHIYSIDSSCYRFE